MHYLNSVVFEEKRIESLSVILRPGNRLDFREPGAPTRRKKQKI